MEKATGIKEPTIIHLVLTRFNIQYLEEDTVGIQATWLEQRCTLFEKYCLPSLQAQTCKSFTWILIIDERTPELYRSRIMQYEKVMPQIHVQAVCFYPETEDLFHQIGQHYGGENVLLITSRVDNDDCLGPNYIASVQELAKQGFKGIISFPEGKQTFIKDNVSYRVKFIDNHFLSRIESSGFYTVMDFNHRHATQKGVISIPTEQPMWEEIVHTNNMLNDFLPEYHYYITDFSVLIGVSRKWCKFQYKRAIRRLQRLFISFH